jgi:hypothetical protein
MRFLFQELLVRITSITKAYIKSFNGKFLIPNLKKASNINSKIIKIRMMISHVEQLKSFLSLIVLLVLKIDIITTQFIWSAMISLLPLLALPTGYMYIK